MAIEKLATRTHKVGYQAIYFTEGENAKLCEYNNTIFDSFKEVTDFLSKQSEKNKGYIMVSYKRDIYILK